MKLFKSSILAILALAASATFTSCSDDNNIVDAPDTGVYIMSQGNTINLPSEGNEVILTVARHATTDPKSVAVTFTDASGIFSGASTVEFDGDALTTTYKVIFDEAQIVEDTEYNVEIKLDPAQSSHYGVTDYTVKFVRLSPWKSLGKATYRDDIVAGIFPNAGNQEYQVEILENEKTPGKYRLVNPYGKLYPLNEPGDYDDSKDYYMEIDATVADRVNIGLTHTGMNWNNYGEITFISRAQFFIDNGNDPEVVYQAGWFGKLENGVITFPHNGFLSGMGDGEYALPSFYGNGNDMFRIVLPGTVIADYSAEIEYTGRFVDASDAAQAVLSVTLGADVTKAIVAGAYGTSDADAVAASVIEGTLEGTEITESGEVRLPITESGIYTFVVVTYAGDESKEYASATVKIEMGGSGDWVDAGTALILDGWMLPAAEYDPFEMMWSTTYQTSASNPGLIKIVEMYGANSPMAKFSLGKYDILIDVSDPELVVMEPQSTGNKLFTDGIMTIANSTYLYLQNGATKEQIVSKKLNCTYYKDENDYVIEFPVTACVFNFGTEDWYQTKSQAGFILTPAEAAAAKHVTVSSKQFRSTVHAKAQRLAHPALAGTHKNVTAKKVSYVKFGKAK